MKADEVGDKLRREAGEGFTDFNKEEVRGEARERGRRTARKMTQEQLKLIEENKKKLKERSKAKEADEKKEKNGKILQEQDSNKQENQPKLNSEQVVNLF